MKILIIGSGRREHAIGRKLLENPRLERLYFASGNGVTAQMGENISLIDYKVLADFSLEKGIDLNIVGSEALLVDGIVDVFQKRGLLIFRPHKHVAKLEGSKVFAKNFMKKYGVRTAAYAYFSDYGNVIAYLDELNYPVVIKASGLASGKGVIIAQDKESSFKVLELIMKDKIFVASATNDMIIEEYLQGREALVLSVFNGKEIFHFLSAKDHKKIGEGETGPNTGRTGVVAPNPHMNEVIWQDFDENIFKPILQGLSAEKLSFAGVIFFGLMITERGVYLLEYNMRMGDSEKQSLFPLMESDFLEMIEKFIKGEYIEISWKPTHSCGVVMASGGYPGSYRKRYEINGI